MIQILIFNPRYVPLFFQKSKLNSSNINGSYWPSNLQFVIVELHNDLKILRMMEILFSSPYLQATVPHFNA